MAQITINIDNSLAHKVKTYLELFYDEAGEVCPDLSTDALVLAELKKNIIRVMKANYFRLVYDYDRRTALSGVVTDPLELTE